MAARWATTYKVDQVHDKITKGYEVNKDKAYFDMKRNDLGQPTRALIAVSAWRREDGGPEKLKKAIEVASSTYGDQKEIPTGTLLLDDAALVLAGTTDELKGLLNDMAATWTHKVSTISAKKPDMLCLAYARIVQKRAIKGTDTVVVIAPMAGWWMKGDPLKGDGVKKPEDIYTKNSGRDGGWRAFGPSTPQSVFILTDLKDLLQTGHGQKAWIKADPTHFKDENS